MDKVATTYTGVSKAITNENDHLKQVDFREQNVWFLALMDMKDCSHELQTLLLLDHVSGFSSDDSLVDWLTGGHKIVESSYDFSVLDSNSLSFVFKYAPEAAKILNIGADFPFEAANRSDRSSWVVC